jgi:hypothetical protein
MTRTCFQIGSTGVTPVKSGVPPDFVRGWPLLFAPRIQGQPAFPYGFGRDARNNRPEVYATHRILKTNPGISTAEALP